MDDLIAYLADFAANPESAKQLLDIGEETCESESDEFIGGDDVSSEYAAESR